MGPGYVVAPFSLISYFALVLIASIYPNPEIHPTLKYYSLVYLKRQKGKF